MHEETTPTAEIPEDEMISEDEMIRERQLIEEQQATNRRAMLEILAAYQDVCGTQPFALLDVAHWAIWRGLYDNEPEYFCDDLEDALTEARFVAPDGETAPLYLRAPRPRRDDLWCAKPEASPAFALGGGRSLVPSGRPRRGCNSPRSAFFEECQNENYPTRRRWASNYRPTWRRSIASISRRTRR